MSLRTSWNTHRLRLKKISDFFLCFRSALDYVLHNKSGYSVKRQNVHDKSSMVLIRQYFLTFQFVVKPVLVGHCRRDKKSIYLYTDKISI